MRWFAALTNALNRHHGKGQQVVRVEHVTVRAGGQAIVGAVTQGGGGGHKESEDRPHALAHTPEPEMRGADPNRKRLPVAGVSVGNAAGCMAAPGAAARPPAIATP